MPVSLVMIQLTQFARRCAYAAIVSVALLSCGSGGSDGPAAPQQIVLLERPFLYPALMSADCNRWILHSRPSDRKGVRAVL